MVEQMIKNLWPDWDVVAIIGRGSFGSVYKIERKIFDGKDEAALKVISIPQNRSDVEELYDDGYDDESIKEAFDIHVKSIVREYTMMRNMSGCHNIVNCENVKYIEHTDGIGWDVFIKMELLTPLTKTLDQNISEATVITVAKHICNALEECKKNNIIHRDIKPQNIFLSKNGDYKLGDFGIAKTVEKTMGGTKIGTYSYMAPEVYNNKPYGSAADIYSLGLVLYWMLNNRRLPFMPPASEKIKAGAEEIARNRRLSGEQLPEPANGSPQLKRIVLKACSYEVDQRYQSAAEMLMDIEKEFTPKPAPAPVPAPEPKSEPKSKPGGGKKPFKIKKIFAGINNRKVLLFAIIFILTLVVLGSAVIGGLVLSGKMGKIDFSLNDMLNRNKIEQYLDKNKLDEAWQFYIESLSEDEKTTELYYELCYAYGKKYYEEKNYSSAKNWLEVIENDYVHFEEAQELLWDAEVEYARQLYNKKDYHRVITSLEIIPTSYKNYDKVEELLNEAKYSYIKENETRNDRTFKYLNDLKAIKYKDTQQIYDKLCEWDAEVFFNEYSDDTTTKKSSMSVGSVGLVSFYHVVVTGGPPYEEIELYARIYYPDGTSEYDYFYDSFSDGSHDSGYLFISQGKGTYQVKIYDNNNNLLAENSLKIY